MVNETEFRNKHFETRGIIEPIARVADGFGRRQDHAKLVHFMKMALETAQKLTKETTGKFKSKENLLEDECDIRYNTYKKSMGRKQLSRFALAKFIIGLSLSLDKANELFRLHSGELNDTNDLDYITIHALKDGDRVDSFIEEVKKYTNINVRSDFLYQATKTYNPKLLNNNLLVA